MIDIFLVFLMAMILLVVLMGVFFLKFLDARRNKSINEFINDRQCNSCKKGYDGTGGNGYQPCSCNTTKESQ